MSEKFPRDTITSEDKKRIITLASEVDAILNKYIDGKDPISAYGTDINKIKGFASQIEKQSRSLKTQD